MDDGFFAGLLADAWIGKQLFRNLNLIGMIRFLLALAPAGFCSAVDGPGSDISRMNANPLHFVQRGCD